MKILLFVLAISYTYCLSAQTEERVCMEKVFGEDTIRVYSNTDNSLVPCRFPTKILLTHNGKQYIVWTNADSLFIERHSTIKELSYESNSKTLSLIYYSHRYARKYMPNWVRFICDLRNNMLTWTPTCYYLPVKETDIAHDKTYLVNTDLVVSYYRSLPQPIVYIINRAGELVEYRDGEVVDKNTVPYRTPFKPHIPTPTPTPPTKH
jgi:hypothetical protein